MFAGQSPIEKAGKGEQPLEFATLRLWTSIVWESKLKRLLSVEKVLRLPAENQ